MIGVLSSRIAGFYVRLTENIAEQVVRAQNIAMLLPLYRYSQDDAIKADSNNGMTEHRPGVPDPRYRHVLRIASSPERTGVP